MWIIFLEVRTTNSRRSSANGKVKTVPNPPVKVLHVVHWPVSGIGSLLKTVLPCQSRADIESHIIFFCHDTNTIKEFSALCASAQSLSPDASFLRRLVEYARLIRQISPDILHTHSFQPMLWGALFNRGRACHVVTIHSNYPYFHEKSLKAFIKRQIQVVFCRLFLTRVIGVSNMVVSTLAQLGIPQWKLRLVENGIPLADHAISPDATKKAREEIAAGPEDFVIVTIGRIDKLKGHPYLIEAFHMASQRHKHLLLILVGEGEDRPKLEGLARKLGIAHQVRFLGYKKNPDFYLDMADLYICSSITEGFSLAVTEAMYHKLAVIATRVGSNPDLIEHGISGLLVDPHSSQAIATALDDVIENRYDRASLGEHARTTIATKYDIKRTADAYLRLYQELIKSSSSPSSQAS
jgi:glycosyltransferase involved in cell wall biosynthesis